MNELQRIEMFLISINVSITHKIEIKKFSPKKFKNTFKDPELIYSWPAKFLQFYIVNFHNFIRSFKQYNFSNGDARTLNTTIHILQV